MVYADIAYLITSAKNAHGVHIAQQDVKRLIYVDVQSVGRSEYYNAYNAGLQPELVLKLSEASEYNDEPELEYAGKRYRIIRSYRTKDGGVELTIQRSDVK